MSILLRQRQSNQIINTGQYYQFPAGSEEKGRNAVESLGSGRKLKFILCRISLILDIHILYSMSNM